MWKILKKTFLTSYHASKKSVVILNLGRLLLWVKVGMNRILKPQQVEGAELIIEIQIRRKLISRALSTTILQIRVIHKTRSFIPCQRPARTGEHNPKYSEFWPFTRLLWGIEKRRELRQNDILRETEETNTSRWHCTRLHWVDKSKEARRNWNNTMLKDTLIPESRK